MATETENRAGDMMGSKGKKRRDWTKIGTEYNGTDALKAKIDNAIKGFKWQSVPCTLSMAGGMAVKAAAKEFRIPKISYVGESNALAPFGFFGIRALYKNAHVEAFFVDDGVSCVPVCMDVMERT